MTTATVTAEATCGFCRETITLLGGSWTDRDGMTACTDTSAPYVPHKPATAPRSQAAEALRDSCRAAGITATSPERLDLDSELIAITERWT